MIGASQEALHTIAKAHAHGVEVIAMDGNPQAEGLKAADKGLVVDISREKETVEAVRRYQPDFVLTAPIGRYLTTIGAVNDALHLPGISRRAAALCTDKYLFHERLAGEGLRSCHCYRVTGEQDAGGTDRFLLEYPAILKPRYGSGSRGIHMVSGEKELASALEKLGEEEYVLEDCVPGEEYGIDGAVIQGKFYMVLLRRKVNTPPPARQAVGYFSCGREDAFWQQAYEYMEKVAACLGLQECLLHGDVIRGADGPFMIEVSARPSGHNLHNLFTPLCTGIDPAEEYIRYRLGEGCSFTPGKIKPMLIRYFDGQGKIRKVPDKEQIEKLLQCCGKGGKQGEIKLTHWQCSMKEGEILTSVSDGHSLMGRGYYILEGEDRERMWGISHEIMQLFFTAP